MARILYTNISIPFYLDNRLERQQTHTFRSNVVKLDESFNPVVQDLRTYSIKTSDDETIEPLVEDKALSIGRVEDIDCKNLRYGCC